MINNQKILQELIETVKKSSKQMGEPITQGDIALRMGRSSTYLSGLKNGHENVSPQFIALFRQEFKEYLPSADNSNDNLQIAVEASVSVIVEEFSKFRYETVHDRKKYVDELLKEIQSRMIRMKEKRMPGLDLDRFLG